MRIASKEELLQDIKDKVVFIETMNPTEEETLYLLIDITRNVTVLYKRIENEEEE